MVPRLLVALVLLAGCGEGHSGSPGSLPPSSSHLSRYQLPGLPEWPWEGLEYLSGLTYRPSRPQSVVRVAAQRGLGHVRFLTVLARWDGHPAVSAPRGWWVDPVRDREEWLARRDIAVLAGQKYGVRIILCLFDEPTRADRSWVEAALRQEGVTKATATPWLGRRASRETALELAAWWLEGLEPSPWLIVETSNEPDDPWDQDDALEDWLEARGFTVSRNTRPGVDGPYGSPAYLWEHAWGLPGSGWPPVGRLQAVRSMVQPETTATGLSTDGFHDSDFPEAVVAGRSVLELGFGYSVLTVFDPGRP